MEDKDFERIEKLFTRWTDDFGKKLEQQSEDFHRWIGVQGDDLQHKLNLVVEGQQLLVERTERVEEWLEKVETRLDRVEVKIDVVAADLSAHRKDTEAHGTVYRVKED